MEFAKPLVPVLCEQCVQLVTQAQAVWEEAPTALAEVTALCCAVLPKRIQGKTSCATSAPYPVLP